ncbi:hypothetical protein AK812_SmicGene14298 [Symbiodinium microadriaticum]|uniref:Uncharacterized protein n=1 Tax=Symbiodinium microadriaticum TaxID=2951 RepID=A0A1Q9E5S9_SYMMI|nr:hypothetical protein AK812_SmicGene14298 [Symbiodinium microadriaticum]
MAAFSPRRLGGSPPQSLRPGPVPRSFAAHVMLVFLVVVIAVAIVASVAAALVGGGHGDGNGDGDDDGDGDGEGDGDDDDDDCDGEVVDMCLMKLRGADAAKMELQY